MRLLLNGAFDELFQTFESSAFHLEVSDEYDLPEESEPIRRFLAGEPDDYAWQKPWLDLIRGATAAGRRVERLRVVSVPHGDYTRWLLTISALNIQAGEDIRWLRRDAVNGLALAADDFWLFDRTRVVFTLFAADGSFAGGAATQDREIVAHCRRVRDELWPVAVPHADYVR
ncbi:DUF6879 family protein [Actinoplanes aureus]|uniref:DUF6879 domain-containing protein n=1 Tax=Actinoplanes aureus TaxID=2792083 RepID=A0A931C7F7_9ACTN|nr:DUF6879 family protein [Actinoplanes aureus]MBG0562772.1 hypothetical protein [Actinoplanes aureus]